MELEARNEESPMLKAGIEMIMDGTDPVLVEKMLRYMICADKYEGADLLERMMIAEGMLAIQAGHGPRFVAAILGSMLGERLFHEALEIGNPATSSAYSLSIFQTHKQALPECEAFEQRLMRLSRSDFSRTLQGIDRHTMVYALFGCGTAFVYRVGDAMPEKLYTQLCEELDALPGIGIELALRAQDRIIERLKELIRYGEIMEL